MSGRRSWLDEDDHEERKIKKEKQSPPNAAPFHAAATPSQLQMPSVCSNTELSPESVTETLQSFNPDLQRPAISAALSNPLQLMTDAYTFPKIRKEDFQQSNSVQNQSHNNHVNMGLDVSSSNFMGDDSHMYLLGNMYGRLDQSTSLQPATTSTGNLASTSAYQSTANADFPYQFLLQGNQIKSGAVVKPYRPIVYQQDQLLSKKTYKKDASRRPSATATITSSGYDPQPSTSASHQPSASAGLIPAVTADQILMSTNDSPSTSTATRAVFGNNGTNHGDAAISSTSSAFEGQVDARANPVSSTSSGARPRADSEDAVKPEQERDEVYWEKRKKNNESAKRSREARKMKEVEISNYCEQLHMENVAIMAQIELFIHDCSSLERILYGFEFNNYRGQLLMLSHQNQGELYPLPPDFNQLFHNHGHQPPPPPPPPPPPSAGPL